MADSIASTSALPLAEASPLLSTSEKVLLAQAVVELGNLDWSAVSALLSTSEALVPEVGERFTAEFCSGAFTALCEAEGYDPSTTAQPNSRPSRKLAHKYYQQRLHELVLLLQQNHASESQHLIDLSSIRSGAWDDRLKAALPHAATLTSPPRAGPTSPVVQPKSASKARVAKGRKGKGASEVLEEEVLTREDVEMAEVEREVVVEVPVEEEEEEEEEEEKVVVVEPVEVEAGEEKEEEEVLEEPEAEEEVKAEVEAESEGLTELEQSPPPTRATAKKSVFKAGGAGGGGTIGGVKKGGRKSARGKAAEEEVEVPAEEDAGTEDGQEEVGGEVDDAEEEQEEEQEEETKTRDRKGRRKPAAKATKKNNKRKASEPVDAGSPSDTKSKKRLKTEELSEDPALTDKAQKTASAQFKRAVGTVIDGLSNEPSAHHFKSRIPKSLAAAYDEIVYRPMHIAELKANVKNGKVATPKEVMRDVALMLANAQQYNGPQTEVGEAAQQLWTVFEELMKPLLTASIESTQ